MKNYDELIADIRGLFYESTQGKWKRGATSHHTVTATGYKIGEFHHASDAAFCGYMHAHAEGIITAIQKLQAENERLTIGWRACTTVLFKANGEIDEYRKAADDMAAAHKVERDELLADKEVLLSHMDTIRNCTNDPAISNLSKVVLERMAQGGEK